QQQQQQRSFAKGSSHSLAQAITGNSVHSAIATPKSALEQHVSRHKGANPSFLRRDLFEEQPQDDHEHEEEEDKEEEEEDEEEEEEEEEFAFDSLKRTLSNTSLMFAAQVSATNLFSGMRDHFYNLYQRSLHRSCSDPWSFNSSSSVVTLSNEKLPLATSSSSYKLNDNNNNNNNNNNNDDDDSDISIDEDEVQEKTAEVNKGKDKSHDRRNKNEDLAQRHSHVLIIQMEMCEQGTLKEWLQQRREVDPLQSWHILFQIAQGLHHIHTCHVLHRDVKPDNVFMCENHIVKLGDFGLSVHPPSEKVTLRHRRDEKVFRTNLSQCYSHIFFFFYLFIKKKRGGRRENTYTYLFLFFFKKKKKKNV
ncbi:eukaryotic translation initiation factor 2 alpha kinase, partial [Reticulomyxa filosa]